MQKKKNWLIVGLIVFSINVAYEVIGGMVDRWLGWDIQPDKVEKFYSWVKQLIKNGLTYAVPVWALIVGILLVVLGYLLFTIYKQKKQRSDSVRHHNYTQDTFGPNQDRWGWYYNDEGEVTGLAPICPTCKSYMNIDHLGIGTFYDTQTAAECSKCRLAGNPYKIVVNQKALDVLNEIYNRIASGVYKTK